MTPTARNLRLARQTVKLQKNTIDALQAQVLRQIDTIRDRDALAALLRQRLDAKVDNSMIEARSKLASQVGQLVEAVSKAVVMLVGKEQL